MNDLIFALVIFVIIIALTIALRAKLGAKFEIRNADILFAIVPIAFWFVLTGKIQKFEFGGLKIEAAFVEASAAAITPQITTIELPIAPIKMDPKLGVEMIPRLIRKKTQALTFQLGYGRYFGPAIKDYLKQLVRMPFFKYVIILQKDGTFAGLAEAAAVDSLLASSESGYNDFARSLNEADSTFVEGLPGYISSVHAVRKDTDKQTALENMESLNLELLPAVTVEGQFAGLIERSRLISSMIIEVTQKLR